MAAALGVEAQAGVVTGPMGWLHALARAGVLDVSTDHLRELLGRTPTGILDQLRETHPLP